MRLSFSVAALNVGRASAERIYGLVEIDCPDGVLVDFRPSATDNKRWRTRSNDRDSFTILLDHLRLPPDSEERAFSVSLDINYDCNRAVDHCLTISLGSSGGPGSVRKIVLPAKLIADAFEHYTKKHTLARDKQILDQKFESWIRDCVK
jgi:hypothetical protein